MLVNPFFVLVLQEFKSMNGRNTISNSLPGELLSAAYFLRSVFDSLKRGEIRRKVDMERDIDMELNIPLPEERGRRMFEWMDEWKGSTFLNIYDFFDWIFNPRKRKFSRKKNMCNTNHEPVNLVSIQFFYSLSLFMSSSLLPWPMQCLNRWNLTPLLSGIHSDLCLYFFQKAESGCI